MLGNFLKKTDGNVSVLFAGGISVLLLSAAVVVDISSTHSAKNKMQNSLDSAVLNAALNIEEQNALSFGEELYLKNLSSDVVGGSVVDFQVENGRIIGTARASRPNIFPGILPESTQFISVKSVAEIPQGEPTPCLMSLSENASPGITLNSGTTIEAQDCIMHVHSQSGNAMTVNSGVNMTLDKVCVAGNNIIDNSNGAIGTLETNCAVTPDPFVGTVVEPTNLSCDYNNGNFGGSNITMQPGVYCGWFNFNNSNADVHFEPGLYVLKNGGWNVNGGNWTGDDVTFYYDDNSKIQFNSGVEANMSAPTTGDYAGFFMTERPNLSGGSFILNDNKGFDFEGVMYLPSRHITMNGQSTLLSRKLVLIADRLTFNSSQLSLETISGSSSATGSDAGVYLSE